MSTVLWTNSLTNGKVGTDSDDKVMLFKYTTELSRLIDSQGRKLEQFVDGTEAKAIVSDDYEGFEDGWGLIKHRAKWHDPDEGLALLRYLAAQLDTQGGSVGIPARSIAALKDEISRCETFLTKTKAEGGRFNLAIVM